MTHPSASFSFTLRVRLENPDLARAIADAGGLLDAIDLVRAEGDSKVRDISVLAMNADHVDAIVRARSAIGGVGVKAQYAEETNPENEQGSADDVLAGADVYIGLSQRGAVTAAWAHPRRSKTSRR